MRANAAASTASHPASLTIAIRPSVERDGESSRIDLGQREQIFFGKSEKKDSTALSTNRPTGKSRGCSPDGAQRNPGPASRDSRISLRSIRATMFANGSRACAPDDRLRDQAIQKLLPEGWIASSLRSSQ